jgi:hypothetical protein
MPFPRFESRNLVKKNTSKVVDILFMPTGLGSQGNLGYPRAGGFQNLKCYLS